MSIASDKVAPEFSLADARNIVGDLFTPNPMLYWADLVGSHLVGSACLLAAQFQPAWSLRYFILMLVGVLAYYRILMFVHELAHLRDGTFNAFRFLWNTVCGIPFVTPSFTYYTHLDHHRRKNFGTDRDGEYVPFGYRRPIAIVLYLAQVFFIPLVAILRFLIVTPLTWLHPKIRDFIHKRASSLVIDMAYVRPLPTRDELHIIRLQEFLCFVWLLLFLLLGPRILEWLPIHLYLQVYMLAVAVTGLNALRTIGAHRWHNAGGEITFVEQMLDSVNYPRRPFLTELWAPVGLRFHALHHLFPSLPYHNLPAAHRRLMADLPANSPYRRVQADSLVGVIRELWQRAQESQRRPQTSA